MGIAQEVAAAVLSVLGALMLIEVILCLEALVTDAQAAGDVTLEVATAVF